MKRLKPILLILFLLLLTQPVSAARSTTAVITDCRVITSKTLRVTATLSNPSAVAGDTCYLFAIPISDTTIAPSQTPLKSVKKAKKMTISAPIQRSKTSSGLYMKYALAQKNADGTYTIISNMKILSDLGVLASYKYAFPVVASKKGLQVNANMLEDAVELNVQHSVLNINFSDLFATQSEYNEGSSIPYKYHGTTYWFRKGTVGWYDHQLQVLSETNCVVSAILLLTWRNDLADMIYPSGRAQGHSYYAWNVHAGSGREKLQAAISFLAKRYSASNGANGRIVNWIVGNEVNNYNTYNYAGNKTLDEYSKIYAQAFLLTYQTVTSIYSNARVYISLDHLWNTNTVSGTFAARKMLDSFAQKLSAYGNVRWNLAYHPYSCPLTEPKFWKNVNGQLTQSLTSPVINMGNISLLTNYIRSTYGKDCRIILSEQGYTSVQYSKNVEKAQAAAIAYTYLLAEADDQIDSFIMHRHVDHDVEIRQGLNLGLWTTKSALSPENADQKKFSWEVFKYMDSNQSEKYTSFALDEIGIKKWSQVIAKYNPSLYSKYNIVNGDLTIGAYQKNLTIPANWKMYGAASGIAKMTANGTNPGGFRVTHDSSRNRNCLWGISQKFAKPLNFRKSPQFCATVRVTGSSAPQIQLLIRLYSGRNVFECRKAITADQDVPVIANLQKWKYADMVSKIQVLVAPVSDGSWKGNAAVEIKNM